MLRRDSYRFDGLISRIEKFAPCRRITVFYLKLIVSVNEEKKYF